MINEHSERWEIERKLKRLKDARTNYGIRAMRTFNPQEFERCERMANTLSERIWKLEEQLEGVK